MGKINPELAGFIVSLKELDIKMDDESKEAFQKYPYVEIHSNRSPYAKGMPSGTFNGSMVNLEEDSGYNTGPIPISAIDKQVGFKPVFSDKAARLFSPYSTLQDALEVLNERSPAPCEGMTWFVDQYQSAKAEYYSHLDTAWFDPNNPREITVPLSIRK